MNNFIFWVAMFCYALHILEEFFYDWQSWAQNILKLQVDWTGFYLTNAVVLFVGVACASVGWSRPFFSLAYPALMIINAVFFHILPTLITRKFSPGLITAILLFLPVGIKAYSIALLTGVSTTALIISVLEGMFIMAYPIVLLKTKGLKLFKQ